MIKCLLKSIEENFSGREGQLRIPNRARLWVAVSVKDKDGKDLSPDTADAVAGVSSRDDREPRKPWFALAFEVRKNLHAEPSAPSQYFVSGKFPESYQERRLDYQTEPSGENVQGGTKGLWAKKLLLTSPLKVIRQNDPSRRRSPLDASRAIGVSEERNMAKCAVTSNGMTVTGVDAHLFDNNPHLSTLLSRSAADAFTRIQRPFEDDDRMAPWLSKSKNRKWYVCPILVPGEESKTNAEAKPDGKWTADGQDTGSPAPEMRCAAYLVLDEQEAPSASNEADLGLSDTGLQASDGSEDGARLKDILHTIDLTAGLMAQLKVFREYEAKNSAAAWLLLSSKEEML